MTEVHVYFVFFQDLYPQSSNRVYLDFQEENEVFEVFTLPLKPRTDNRVRFVVN